MPGPTLGVLNGEGPIEHKLPGCFPRPNQILNGISGKFKVVDQNIRLYSLRMDHNIPQIAQGDNCSNQKRVSFGTSSSGRAKRARLPIDNERSGRCRKPGLPSAHNVVGHTQFLSWTCIV